MIKRPPSEWVRRANRNPMSITGVAYRSDDSWVRVHITNLSYDGCKLLTEEPLDVGEQVTLVMPKMQHMPAQVRWACDEIAGLRFLLGTAVDDRRARIGV